MELDSTVRSQNSNDSKGSKDSKPESCSVESKHSKEILIIKSEKEANGAKDDSNLLMFTSCGQLLLGVVLVVFGVLVLVHGASLGGSGAGLWAGAGALVAGALGVVATLATSTNSSKTTTIPQPTSGFATAHLASSLVALALSNMAAITALTAVVRDSQRTPELTLLETMDEDGSVVGVERGWAGLLASIGLLIASVAELIISAHSCVTLAPRLCGCLRSSPSTSSPSATTKDGQVEGQLKTHNMVHQWVTAQTHNPKSQQIYLVQPVMPMQTMLQTPYGMSTVPGKYPGGLIPAGTMPPPSAYHHPPGSMITAVPPGYKVARGPHPLRSPNHPPNYHPQMIRVKRKRYVVPENELETASRRRKQEMQPQSKAVKKMLSAVGEDQVDMAHTYTGLDKRISEEFIAIAMDPDRKSKASSNNGSEIGSGLGKPAEGFAHSKL